MNQSTFVHIRNEEKLEIKARWDKTGYSQDDYLSLQFDGSKGGSVTLFLTPEQVKQLHQLLELISERGIPEVTSK